jgi:hypothetical protein
VPEDAVELAVLCEDPDAPTGDPYWGFGVALMASPGRAVTGGRNRPVPPACQHAMLDMLKELPNDEGNRQRELPQPAVPSRAVAP